MKWKRKQNAPLLDRIIVAFSVSLAILAFGMHNLLKTSYDILANQHVRSGEFYGKFMAMSCFEAEDESTRMKREEFLRKLWSKGSTAVPEQTKEWGWIDRYFEWIGSPSLPRVFDQYNQAALEAFEKRLTLLKDKENQKNLVEQADPDAVDPP